ncbi:MAG: helix-turn-helix domain-containing protein [Oscillospiraceae bacterium]|nr:helix-turn-helix domain-containing protein [Oscillospiraceae bacterium]
MFEGYKDVVTVRDLAKMLNIGHNTAYALLKSNQISHVRVGRKYIIPKQSVIGFVEKMCYNNSMIINGRLNNQSSKGESP